MRLVDLHPMWLGAGGEGVYSRAPDGSLTPAPEREGVAIAFDCPCGCGTVDDGGGVCIPLANPLDGGSALEPRGWQRTGDTFETLTLSPSILRSKDKGGCGWHGWIRNGEVVSC